MPKQEINYSNTIFYKIICNDLNITECYVGHTSNFTKRKYGHKRCCNNENSKQYNFYVYDFIRNNGGWDNWTMIMIDEVKCENSLEARKKEREYIEELKASLNCRIPSRTLKENYEDKKDIRLEYAKVYRENNVEKIKDYYDEKKDKLLDYAKNYREQNKEKIFKQSQKQIYCDCCKMDIRYSHIARHNKSAKHKKHIVI